MLEMNKNYYQTLGLVETASLSDIKKAYHEYARRFHPDKHEGEEFYKRRFQEVLEAYEYLKEHYQENLGDSDDVSFHATEDKNANDLEKEALKYYNTHEIEILEEYGFFMQKKKRQAFVIWESCLISMGLTFCGSFILIYSLGASYDDTFSIILYALSLLVGYLPGMYIGPIILGIKDKSQFRELESNIKEQFIKDYIRKNS